VAQRDTMTLADRVNTQLLIYPIISPTPFQVKSTLFIFVGQISLSSFASKAIKAHQLMS